MIDMSEINWKGVFQSKIRNDGDNFVTIPEELFDENKADILDIERLGFWSYNRDGLVLISNSELEDPDPQSRQKKYKFVDANNINKSRVTTVPGRFFSDYEGAHGPITEPDLKYDPRFRYGQKVFFAYYEGMADPDNTQSCFVLTQSQLTDLMGGNSPDLSFGSVPSFI